MKDVFSFVHGEVIAKEEYDAETVYLRHYISERVLYTWLVISLAS